MATSNAKGDSEGGVLTRGMWLTIGLALLVGGMALSVGPEAEARVARQLAAVGVSTSATVVEESVIHRGRRLGTEVRLRVEFTDDIGFPHEATGVYCGDPGTKAAGDEVDIVYDPDDPQVFQFSNCHYSTDATGLQLAGIAALAVGSLVVLWVWRAGGWRFGRWGIAAALIGIVFVGASFDDNCGCREFIFFGAALVVIGVAAAIGRTIRPRSSVGEGQDRFGEPA